MSSKLLHSLRLNVAVLKTVGNVRGEEGEGEEEREERKGGYGYGKMMCTCERVTGHFLSFIY